MIQGSWRQWLLEFWHCDLFLIKQEMIITLRAAILVLFMKNHSLKLIGKVHNLSLAVCHFNTLQQGESCVI